MTAPEHVTVAYDSSPHSEVALRRALVAAKEVPLGKVHVVCVAKDVAPHFVRLPSGVVMTTWSARESLRLVVSRSARECDARNLQHRVQSHLRVGDPAQVIVDLAYRFHSDQIMLGARGMEGIYQKGVGSVAGRVLELSEIPVTISMPLHSSPHRERFNAIRWAYVFGGAALCQGTLGAPSAKRVVVSLPS
jgi:nucleotide-binding universal stress UspA family protein